MSFTFETEALYCPSCHGNEVVPLRRREIHDFFILPFLLLRPFGCAECKYRFYGFLFRKPGPPRIEQIQADADDTNDPLHIRPV